MWLDPSTDPLPRAFRLKPRPVAVAVPARDEAARVGACVAALAAAARHPALARCPLTLLVYANNSADGTAAAARAAAAGRWPGRVQVVEARLPPARAHAGGARRAAMALAADGLPPEAALMTTDADSRVLPDWIAANCWELDRGAGAVAGVIGFDAAARAALPPLPGRALEWRLADAHARLEALLDPLPHDPWPRHIWAWGASLAVTVEAWRRCGGVPAVPLAEDRALAAALEAADCRLRRSCKPRVLTSARMAGRAPGGFADLLRSYARDAAAPCDAALEPTGALVRRAALRGRLRAAWGAAGFGARWQALEAAAPALVRARVLPADLPRELALAERWLRRLAPPELTPPAAGPADNPLLAAAA